MVISDLLLRFIVAIWQALMWRITSLRLFAIAFGKPPNLRTQRLVCMRVFPFFLKIVQEQKVCSVTLNERQLAFRFGNESSCECLIFNQRITHSFWSFKRRNYQSNVSVVERIIELFPNRVAPIRNRRAAVACWLLSRIQSITDPANSLITKRNHSWPFSNWVLPGFTGSDDLRSVSISHLCTTLPFSLLNFEKEESLRAVCFLVVTFVRRKSRYEDHWLPIWGRKLKVRSWWDVYWEPWVPQRSAYWAWARNSVEPFRQNRREFSVAERGCDLTGRRLQVRLFSLSCISTSLRAFLLHEKFSFSLSSWARLHSHWIHFATISL